MDTNRCTHATHPTNPHHHFTRLPTATPTAQPHPEVRDHSGTCLPCDYGAPLYARPTLATGSVTDALVNIAHAAHTAETAWPSKVAKAMIEEALDGLPAGWEAKVPRILDREALLALDKAPDGCLVVWFDVDGGELRQWASAESAAELIGRRGCLVGYALPGWSEW